MARSVNLRGSKKKKKIARRTSNKSNEPDLSNGLEMSAADFHKAKSHALDHYRLEHKSSDFKLWTIEYCTNHKRYKDNASAIGKCPEYKFSSTIGGLCRQLSGGMPDIHPGEQEFRNSMPGLMGKARKSTEWIHEQLDALVPIGEAIVQEKKDASVKLVGGPTLSIQDRIRMQAYKTMEAVDDWLDGWSVTPNKFDPTGFNFPKHFIEFKVTQAHARKMVEFYTDEISELEELLTPLSKKDFSKLSEKDQDWAEQLKEAYSCYDKKDLKLKLEGLLNFKGALDLVIAQSKATRKTRKRAPKSKEKLVAKLKYAIKDDKFQIASINPIDIIGCEELWIFNVKTRKLGRYLASSIDPMHLERDGTGLGIKGTTITGFKEESVQKTLRKPQEKLKEFKDAGKIKLRTFLEDINAVDIKLNGRINTDTIILKAVR
jgi:hypothetical protein